MYKKIVIYFKTAFIEYLLLDSVVLVGASPTESNAKIRMKIGHKVPEI